MNKPFPFWQELRKLLVDRLDGTFAERVEAYPPKVLMTDNDGDHARMRVDVSQTGFWAGRMFRTFLKTTLGAGQSATVRATVPGNIILHDTSWTTENSTLEVGLYAGGTADGPWAPIPVFRLNNMTTAPVIANGVTLDYDGAHSGGTLIDLIRIQAGNRQSNISQALSERGVSPGTYYYEMTNAGNLTATVVFSAIWEERQE